MPDFIDRPIAECTATEMAKAFRTIFDDYTMLPPSSFDGAAFERRYVFEPLDRVASTLVTQDGSPAAVLLIARRGRVSHVSGLGVAQPYRRQGLAKRLLTDACRESRQRGDTRIIVEVPTRAAPAHALYSGCGFRHRRRLLGYTSSLADRTSSEGIVETEPGVVADVIAAAGVADLPWFFDTPSIAGCALPTRAFQLDQRAYLVATARDTDLTVRALFVRPDERRRGLATRLLHTVATRTRVETCTVLPLLPEGLCDEFFSASGFVRLAQVHDELELRF